MDDLMSIYIEDIKEYLSILNDSILLLEKSPGDIAAISEMFRSFHTMKSSTAAMDFKKTASFIHRMEDLLQEIRDGKITIDPAIIKMMYKTYDLLEEFLENVIRYGSEGDCDYTDMEEAAGRIICQKGSIANNGTEEADGIITPEPCFRLSEADVEKLREAIWRGSQAYMLTAVINKSCSFKSVRAWMILEELEKLSFIVRSDPAKPDSDDFINGRFDFNGLCVRAVIVLEASADEVLQELRTSVNEVESIELAAIRPDFAQGMAFDSLQKSSCPETVSNPGDDSITGMIDLIIGNDPGRGVEVSDDAVYDSLTGIRSQIKACEISLLSMEESGLKPEDMDKISRLLCCIKEDSDSIGYEMLSDLAQRAAGLCGRCFKNDPYPEDNTVSRLAEMLSFMKKLCENVDLSFNEDFLKDMESKLSMEEDRGKASETAKEARPNPDKLGEILVESGHLSSNDIGDIVKKQKESYPDLKFGQIAVKEDKADLKDIIQALHVQDNSRIELKSQAYIRIPAGKVDNLVDMLGELIITQSLHKQDISEAYNKENNKLVNNILRMERISKDMQDITMSLRMVSLKQTFQKIYRIGRDTALELEKNIEISIKGEETEIDRNVVEKIHDPMMHIIRNAISHGIETETDRIVAGKTPAGNILIQAYNRRGNVYIEISDDGKGMNPDKIYNKAIEKGLADPSRKYTEDEILRFIYLPGFSTEENVNSISGRGVGMNVVQTEITRLGGKIEIDNKQGIGCTFILKIPVNLATINGTIVEISGGKYIVPTLNIKQILKPDAGQWINVKGSRSMVMIRNDILQLIPINSILDTDYAGDENGSGLIIVVEHEQKLMALPVDAIQGKQEVVVKSIGSDFRDLNFVSGATILGDGKVSLILDIEALFRITLDPNYNTINEAV